MNNERLVCAEQGLATVPKDYRTVDSADVAGKERGHDFHRGMHIGWAWGVDERGRTYLDFLSEHRLGGMGAERYFADGRPEPIAVPAEARTVSPDPAEDAKLEHEFIEQNRAAYEDLRHRGLLPPQGANLAPQDINEYLLTGGPDAESGPDVADTVAGARGVRLGGGWDELLREELDKSYWTELLDFVTDEYEHHEVYPPWEQVFTAFEMTPVDQVKVVIVGQDPYTNPGQATGLAFSVPKALRPLPTSLVNIHAAMRHDGFTPPVHGDLASWAEQGVLLLNTALTGTTKPGAHLPPWRPFIDGVLADLAARDVVMVAWGRQAQRAVARAGAARVVAAPHPAARGRDRTRFRDAGSFTAANELLDRPIEWS